MIKEESGFIKIYEAITLLNEMLYFGNENCQMSLYQESVSERNL